MNTTNTVDIRKLLAGGWMTSLCEMSIGGHHLETIKIQKQITNRSYISIMKNLWNTDGIKCFHKGFYPWGTAQMIKGIPLFYAQYTMDKCFKQ